jgi:hypothetical protein
MVKEGSSSRRERVDVRRLNVVGSKAVKLWPKIINADQKDIWFCLGDGA